MPTHSPVRSPSKSFLSPENVDRSSKSVKKTRVKSKRTTSTTLPPGVLPPCAKTTAIVQKNLYASHSRNPSNTSSKRSPNRKQQAAHRSADLSNLRNMQANADHLEIKQARSQPPISSYGEYLAAAREASISPKTRTPQASISRTPDKRHLSEDSNEDSRVLKRAVVLSETLNRHSARRWDDEYQEPEEKSSEAPKTGGADRGMYKTAKLPTTRSLHHLFKQTEPEQVLEKRSTLPISPSQLQKPSLMDRNQTLKQLQSLGHFELVPSDIATLDNGLSDSDCSEEELEDLEAEMNRENLMAEVRSSVESFPAYGGEPLPNTPKNAAQGIASKFIDVDEDRRISKKLAESARGVNPFLSNSMAHWKNEKVSRLLIKVNATIDGHPCTLEVTVRVRNIEVNTIGNAPLYSNGGDIIKTLEHGRVCECYGLEKRVVNGEELYVVPAIDAGGRFMPLFKDGKQCFEISDATWDFMFLTKINAEGQVSEYQMFDVKVQEDDDENSLLFEFEEDGACHMKFDSCNQQPFAAFRIYSKKFSKPFKEDSISSTSPRGAPYGARSVFLDSCHNFVKLLSTERTALFYLKNGAYSIIFLEYAIYQSLT